MKQRYTLRVQRSDVTATTVIGEYTVNATHAGIRQLVERIKPEFTFDIMSNHGIIYSSERGPRVEWLRFPGYARCSECGNGEKQGHAGGCSKLQRWTPETARQRVGGTFGS